MGQANSDNNQNNGTLDKFFAVFTSGGSPAQRAAALTNLFCQDDPLRESDDTGGRNNPTRA